MHNIFIRTFKAGRTKRIVIVEQVSIEHRVVFFSLNSNGFNGIVPSEFLIAKLESLYLPFMSLFHKLQYTPDRLSAKGRRGRRCR